MNSKIIDISVPLEKEMPIWPDSNAISLEQVSNLENNDLANVTSLKMDVHIGTHIENSLHFIADGESIDKILLETLIGPVKVVYLPEIRTITVKDLKNLDLNKNITRLLFKTSNSKLWQKKENKFQKDYVGLDSSAALWLTKTNIKLIGIDYLSIAKFDEAVEVHQILMKNNLIVLETLNLSEVQPGNYKLICLPLKLIGIEAAPARAVLITL